MIEIKKAIRANPNFGPAHVLLGMIYHNRDRDDLALFEAREAIRMAPDDPFSHYLLGEVLGSEIHKPEYRNDRKILEEMSDEGIKALRQAVKIKPENPFVHRELSHLYMHKGLLDLSLFEARTAVQLDDTPYRRRWLAWVLLLGDAHDEATQEYEHALAQRPGYSTVLLQLGYLHFLRREYMHTATWFTKYAAQTKSPDAYATIFHAIALQELGRQAEARSLLRKFAQIFEGKVWEAQLLQFHLGEVTEASLLAAAGARDVERSEAWFYAGYQRALQGDTEIAEEYFQNVRELRLYYLIEYVAAAAALERLQARKGERKKAVLLQSKQ